MNVLAMKGPADLHEGLQIWLKVGDRRIQARYVDREDQVRGQVTARIHSDFTNLWEVKSAEAPNGYGPLLYHCVMEMAGVTGVICSDRNGCSLDAAAVWEFFRYCYRPISIGVLPEDLWVRHDAYTDRQLDALNCVYIKPDRAYTDELYNLNKLVFEYE